MRDPQARCKPQALLATHLEPPCAQRLAWCVRRWTMDVTCEAARAHLGMETQRQWNARASGRATPALLSLDAIITLTTQLLMEKGGACGRRTAWYGKTRPPFADAMALGRRQLWDHIPFSTSLQDPDMIQIPREGFDRFIDAVGYAA
jgi:hypothetical protein